MADILLGFVGDLLVNRSDPDAPFVPVRELLGQADILFGNMEGAYTDTPHVAPGQLDMISGKAANLAALGRAGFHVLSLANNHILDVGTEAMLENRARLAAMGVATCGAGSDLEDARAPALVDRGGIRFAYLGYASVFPFGYEAYATIPGLVPIRAYDHWRPAFFNLHMPGARPIASTVPDERDLANLVEDIARARKDADIVITSFHWGDQSRPFHLTDHETRTARFCIDHGADMVIGHHHHAMRGIEWYCGKPILYGLGHFVFDFRLNLTPDQLEAFKMQLSRGDLWDAPYVVGPRDGWPYLPMHEDMRLTMVAFATVGSDGIDAVSVVPCRLQPDGAVQPVAAGDPAEDQWSEYFQNCLDWPGLNGAMSASSIPGLPLSAVGITPRRGRT
ncbi:CapA family protein [Rhizorhabdus dicambivorans]|uniref:Capsule biosynthesis protein CapA n=1 Tax=Rhizorhabdus dicambivorans TaxID=1850238 RepID=A0A2A4FQW1_9SPHN|nr:CapA family protein [Rhizorhabdus dicambivorans]ATE65771.1 capsule biosynthesis protein CapA [Rhizorhabdus dicambivorans]PCE41145.1 capsule biosynthesis protein CapA [Rhizorhabdus dicambivorans]